MNKALYLPALLLGLAASPVPGSGPLPAAAVAVSNASTGLPRDASGGSGATAQSAVPTYARFGTQKLAYQSLIHQDRDRPGAVAEWRHGPQTGVRGFVFHPEIEGGQRRPVEAPEFKHQLLGVVAEHAVLLGRGDALTFQGGWVTGSELSDSAASYPASSGTRAWSLGANATLLDRRLRLSAEQAGTGREEGRAPALSGTRAEARRITAEWGEARSGRVGWHAKGEYTWVGPDFESAANGSIPRDRERLRSEGGFEIPNWLFRLSAQRERDNLLQHPARPTQETDRYRVTATWQPSSIGKDWALGRPRITLDAEVGQKRESVESNGGPKEVSAHNRLRLESEFRTAAGRWGVRAARSLTPGTIDSSPGAGVDMSQFEVYRDQRSFKPFPVRTQLQWQLREDRISGTSEDRWQVRFGSRPMRVHQRLGADFDLRYRHHLLSHDCAPQTDMNFSGRLVWTVDRPADGRSGLVLTVSADYRDRQSRSNTDDNDHRLLLTLSSSHPFGDW